MSDPVNRDTAPPVDGAGARLPPWLRSLPDRLWPACCVVCGEPGDGGRDLCRDCRDALPWNRAACPRCALPGRAGGDCDGCRRRPPLLDHALAAFAYGFPLDRLLPRFKFHADLAAGHLAAQLLGDAVAAGPAPAAGCVLVPLPLHRSRLRGRGFDQALELARPLARRFRLPLRPDLLRRVRATAPQTGLDAGGRRRNLAGAFAVRPGPAPARVVLVDDVMTTGASLAAAATALRAAGVAAVAAWVVARATPPAAARDPQSA